jgi:hypothetical protein
MNPDRLSTETRPQARVNIVKATDATSLQGEIPENFKIQIIGNPFHPKDWKPPDRDPKKNCGVDLAEYFTYLLLGSILARVYVAKVNPIVKQNPSITPEQFDSKIKELEKETPILRNAREIQKRLEENNNRLREGGCFFYPKGGSVFTDYKRMRERAQLRIGGYDNPNLSAEEYARIWNKDQAVHEAWARGSQTIENSFNEDMTTEEALRVAKEIIEKFWW